MADQLHYRMARKEDLPTLNIISTRSKQYWNYPDEWLVRWKPTLRLTLQQLLEQEVTVLEIGEQIAGFCSILEHEDHYEIMHLWLLPEFIGKGYGKKLLQEAINRAVVHFKPIVVEADPNAEAFYAAQGFVTYDQVESYPKGRFLPVMKKV